MRRIHSGLFIFACCLMIVTGCGQSSKTSVSTAEIEQYQMASAEAGSVTDQPSETVPKPADRKIIYTTSLDLIVEDYVQFESDLPQLLTKHAGFVAKRDTNRQYADQQSGVWVLRIPVDAYDKFLSGVVALGFAESLNENAQDVTEEYVDLDVRIANKKKLEQRIVTMLEDRAGKLADVLEIERELARVREEVERMEGRLRLLKDQTSLATVTIRVRERKEYQPPVAPTLISRITDSFSGSVTAMRRFGENTLVAGVAVLPWMLLMSIPGYLFYRKIRRRK